MNEAPLTMYTTHDLNTTKTRALIKLIPMIAKTCKRIMIVALSKWEDPDAFALTADGTPGHAVRVALDHGLGVDLGRKGVPTHVAWCRPAARKIFAELTDPRGFRQAARIASVLGELHAAALSFDPRVKPFYYGEVHAGPNTPLGKWKDAPMGDAERYWIAGACMEAVYYAGSMGMYPLGSGDPDRFMWPFGVIADPKKKQDTVFGVGMYYLHERKPYDKSNPPPGFEHPNVLQGVHVIASSNERQTRYWTPKMVVDRIRGPEAGNGLWLYCGRNVERVTKMLARLR